MCQNRRYVRNAYTGKYILSDCGHCPSCIQKKASRRATRIRNNYNGNIALFVTLTYDNAGVPYFDINDFRRQLETIPYSVDSQGNRFIPDLTRQNLKLRLPIYRNCIARRVRVSTSYDFKSRRRFVRNVIGYFEPDLSDFVSYQSILNELNKCRHLKYMPDRIGLCVYPDVQMFLKRLRQNLKRVYNYEKPFTSFQCSEYGGHSFRPHFHLLIYCPSDAEDTFRSAIAQSWPFGNHYKSGKFIQVARNAASYVASYVNSNGHLPTFFEDSQFKQKHSYSKSFGVGLDCFQLPSLLEKKSRNSLFYTTTRTINGTEQVLTLPLPKYVINRFFPQFKGASNLTSFETVECLQSPARLRYVYNLDYNDEDLRKVSTRLRNAFNYYNQVTGRNFLDYCYDYVDIWNCWKSNVLMYSYQEVRSSVDWLSFYDNGGILNHLNLSPNLLEYLDVQFKGKYFFEVNYNHRLGLEASDNRLEDIYFKSCKQKYVTNQIMASGLGLDV